MKRSPAYAIGVLDALVKSGEISPDYAAGVATVLAKEAGWFVDSPYKNLADQWDDYAAANPGAYNQQTGQTSMTGEQAKRMIDKAQPWFDSFGARAGANVRHWGRVAKSWLPEWLVGKQMSSEESARLREYDRNKIRQDYLNRANGGAPTALYGAFQDVATRDARYARRDQTRYMAPGKLEAEFGETEEDAANKFRTPQGTAMMRGGVYNPAYDKQSAKAPKPSINNNPLAHMYGSKDRQKLFSQSYRNGLGMY